MTARDWTAALKGEALFCGLLGRALYSYPDKAWLDFLIDEDVFANVPLAESQPDVAAGLTLLQAWSALNRGGLSERAFDAVLTDHTRLFVGPGKLLAAPWESVYFDRDRLLFQGVTLQVRDWYARFGLEIASGYREPEDHIGMEFGFLAHLSRLSLQALEAGDSARFEELLQAQRDFLSQHMLRWVPKWCREMDASARTDFYKGLARLARGGLKELGAVYEVTALRGMIV
jgi:TorA maturation chaperone TorD